MCHRAAQNHRCRPNHDCLSRFLIFYFVFFVFLVFWLFSGCLLRDALEIGHPRALKLLPKHSQLAQRAPEISRGASTELPKAQTRSSSLLRPSLSLSLSPSNPLFASSLSPLLPSSLLSSPLLPSFLLFSLRFIPPGATRGKSPADCA